MSKIEQDLKILDVHDQTSFQKLEQEASKATSGSSLGIISSELATLLALPANHSQKVVTQQNIRRVVETYISVIIPQNFQSGTQEYLGKGFIIDLILNLSMYNVINASGKTGFSKAELQAMSSPDLIDKLSEILADQYSIFLTTTPPGGPGTPPGGPGTAPGGPGTAPGGPGTAPGGPGTAPGGPGTPPGTPPATPPRRNPAPPQFTNRYHVLLEDGNFAPGIIESHRQRRIDNVNGRIGFNLSTPNKYDFDNMSSIETAIEDSFDIISADLRNLMLERQEHRFNKQGSLKRRYNNSKEWLEHHPKTRMIAKAGIVLGAAAISPQLGIAASIGGSILGFRNLVSRATVAVRSWKNSDNYRSLAIMQQKEIRNTTDFNRVRSQDAVYNRYENKAQRIEQNLKDRAMLRISSNPIVTDPNSTDAEKLAEINRQMSSEYQVALDDMERERKSLKIVRAGELIGSAALGVGMHFGVKALMDWWKPSGGPPDPSGGGDTPEPPTITEIPTSKFTGEFSTATKLYDSSHSLVDSRDIANMTDINTAVTGAQKTLNVAVNTADSGSAGRLLLRDEVTSKVIGRLNPGEQLKISLENSTIANITDDKGTKTAMRMFKVLNPNGSVRGMVAGAFLKTP